MQIIKVLLDAVDAFVHMNQALRHAFIHGRLIKFKDIGANKELNKNCTNLEILACC